jgi:hypothetical protein
MRRSFVPWLVAAVCLGPFALALLLYYGPVDSSWLPRLPGSRELIEPPLATPAGWLSAAELSAPARFRWSLIYAKMTPCDAQCTQHLGRLRQVQLALGQDQDRVQRVFLHDGEAPGISNDPELATRGLGDSVGESIARAVGADRLRSGRVLIADPRGNLIASYPADVAQKELLRDLKRLLSISGTNR